MGENTRDMKSFASCVVFAICLGAVAAEVYFEEDFSGDWESRWVQSENKDDLGKFAAVAGKNGDASDLGLQTSQDAKFYGISAATKEFSNKDKPLVVQYTVKHEQGIDCGGAYLKIGPAPFDGKKFHGETVYNVMFGPDICGMTKRTHLIFNYKEKNLLKDKDLRTESDELTHIYTLVVKPDNTFAVSIDGSEVESGKLADGWKFLEPKEIDDPEDKKPEGYDDIKAKIADPKATKPDDWDDESDGEWAPKKIANPASVDDQTIGQYGSFGWVGIDVWQVKAGTIFDNLLITDDVETAKAAADKLKPFQEGEKKMKEEKDAEKAKKAEEDRAKAEEERKKKEEEDKAKEEKKKDDKKEDAKEL